MIKYFCDVCGREIKRSYGSKPFSRHIAGLEVTVHVTRNGDDAGDICGECLLEVIAKGVETEMVLDKTQIDKDERMRLERIQG